MPADETSDKPDVLRTRLTCPRCGSADTRTSHKTGLAATLHRIFGRRPYRCRNCRFRFYRPQSEG
jgi:transcription elongation factor Elf1